MAINAKDFTFCDKKLSDFGFIIANIDGSLDDSASAGNVELITSRPSMSEKNIVHGISYGDPITLTFQIVKFDFATCQCSKTSVTRSEQNRLLWWLIKTNYNYLNFDDIPIYFNVTMKVTPKKIGGNIYGFEITATNDSVYSYTAEEEIGLLSTGICNIQGLFECSYNYPKVTLEVVHDGDVVIECVKDRKSVISNCTAGEIITIDCENCIIKSSNSSHNLSTDFNFEFFRIYYDENGNSEITVNNAHATIKYRGKRMAVI